MNSRLLSLALLILAVLPLQAHGDFQPAKPGLALVFPEDHGAHPGYATEWWYFTGHLKDGENSFGFQLVFFRVGIEQSEKSSSAWRTPSIYLAHFALTDDKRQTFRHDERRGRGVLGESGAEEGALHVWIRDWSAKLSEGVLELHAKGQADELTLSLRSNKPEVLHGEQGFSKKGDKEGQASYYVSLTRLTGNGTLTAGGVDHPVQASVWMDHEFFSSAQVRDNLGWDWLAVQLSSGEELMLYRLREENGGISPYSSGSFVAADGSVVHLQGSDFEFKTKRTWKSPKTGAEYPTALEAVVHPMQLHLTIIPTVPDQELLTPETTGVTYWEGRTAVKGTKKDQPIEGEAYLELVGYAPKTGTDSPRQ